MGSGLSLEGTRVRRIRRCCDCRSRHPLNWHCRFVFMATLCGGGQCVCAELLESLGHLPEKSFLGWFFQSPYSIDQFIMDFGRMLGWREFREETVLWIEIEGPRNSVRSRGWDVEPTVSIVVERWSTVPRI